MTNSASRETKVRFECSGQFSRDEGREGREGFTTAITADTEIRQGELQMGADLRRWRVDGGGARRTDDARSEVGRRGVSGLQPAVLRDGLPMALPWAKLLAGWADWRSGEDAKGEALNRGERGGHGGKGGKPQICGVCLDAVNLVLGDLRCARLRRWRVDGGGARRTDDGRSEVGRWGVSGLQPSVLRDGLPMALPWAGLLARRWRWMQATGGLGRLEER